MNNNQLFNFIQQNQENYSLSTLFAEVQDIQQIKNDHFAILTKDKILLIQLPQIIIKSEQLKKEYRLFDKKISTNEFIYLLYNEAVQEFCLIKIMKNEYIIQLSTARANIEYNFQRLVFCNLIDFELLLFEGLMLRDNQIFHFFKGIYECNIEPYQAIYDQEILGIYHLSNSILINTNDSNFIIRDDEIIDLNFQFHIESVQNQQSENSNCYLLHKDKKQIINLLVPDYKHFKLDQPIDCFAQNEEKLLAIMNLNSEIQVYDLLNNAVIINLTLNISQRKIQQCYLLNQFLMLCLIETELIILFKPNFQLLLDNIFYVQPKHITLQSTVKCKQSCEQEKFIQQLKKTNVNLDDLIDLAIKKSYLGLLLLLCSRIRVYTLFFIQCVKISENNHEETIVKLLNQKILKKYECIENNLILEEFLEGLIQFRNKEVIIYFNKFLIENPLIVPQSYYFTLLDHKFDRNLYQKKNLMPPVIPLQAFQRQIAYVKFLQQSRQIFYEDYCKIKVQNVEKLNKGVIGNAQRCFVCKQEIEIQAKQNKESRIVKYTLCHHTIHFQCHTQTHDCHIKQFLL